MGEQHAQRLKTESTAVASKSPELAAERRRAVRGHVPPMVPWSGLSRRWMSGCGVQASKGTWNYSRALEPRQTFTARRAGRPRSLFYWT
jgi:hypothetical protein